MGQGMGILGPFLPLLGLAALVITSMRRRKERREKYAKRKRHDRT